MCQMFVSFKRSTKILPFSCGTNFFGINDTFYNAHIVDISCKLTKDNPKSITSSEEIVRLITSKAFVYPLGAITNNKHPRVHQLAGKLGSSVPDTGTGCWLLKVRGSLKARGSRSATTHKLGQSAITRTTTHRHPHIHTQTHTTQSQVTAL